MTSNKEVSSPIPALSKLDGLEKILVKFDRMTQKAGLQPKKLRETATRFLEKFAEPDNTGKPLQLVGEPGLPHEKIRAAAAGSNATQPTTPGEASGSAVRNTVEEIVTLAERMPVGFSEGRISKQGQQSIERNYASGTTLSANMVVPEVMTGKPKADRHGKPAAALGSIGTDAAYEQLIKLEDWTQGNFATTRSDRQQESSIEAPRTAHEKGFWHTTRNWLSTIKNEITGSRNSETQHRQELIEKIEQVSVADTLEQEVPRNSMQNIYSSVIVDNYDYPNAENTVKTTSLTQLLAETEKAAESITTSGSQVTNYNITINDGLIKQVDNHFASTNESPESAENFMKKLTGTLRVLFNDVKKTSTTLEQLRINR